MCYFVVVRMLHGLVSQSFTPYTAHALCTRTVHCALRTVDIWLSL